MTKNKCPYICRRLPIQTVARAHEMMTDGVAAAGRSAELSPEVDWSGRRRVGTIVGGIRTDMDGTTYW